MIEGKWHIKTFQEMTKIELISKIYNLQSKLGISEKAIEELKRINEILFWDGKVPNVKHIILTFDYMKMLELQVSDFRSGKIADKESFANMCLEIIEEWSKVNGNMHTTTNDKGI